MQERINTFNEGEWASCRDVQLRDGILRCSLAQERYVLTEAYENDLHIRFANSKTDHDLVTFVQAWGPLDLTNGQKRSGSASFPLSNLRALQRWFRALLDVLAAFKEAKHEQTTLQEFVEAEYEYARNSTFPSEEPFAMPFLRQKFGLSGGIIQWVKNADLPTVRTATDLLVSLAEVGPKGAHLVFRRRRDRRFVEAGWTISCLEDALRWMIWYDEFTKHPLVCCPECRTVFRRETEHPKKYCTHDCAHRASARVWQRKKRAKQHARRK